MTDIKRLATCQSNRNRGHYKTRNLRDALKAEMALICPDVDTLLSTHHTKVAQKSHTRAGVAELADALDLGSCSTHPLPSSHHANSVTEGFLMRCGCFTESTHSPCEYALDETFNETSPQTPTVAFYAVAAPDRRGLREAPAVREYAPRSHGRCGS